MPRPLARPGARTAGAGGSQRKGRRFPVTAFRRAKAARRHSPGAGRPAEVLLCDRGDQRWIRDHRLGAALLADINQRLNLTIVLITHQLEVVKTICDHAALLEQGEIVESGKLADLLVTPWSRLRQSLLHDPQAEQEFLTRHGVQEAIMRSSMIKICCGSTLLLDGTLDTLYMMAWRPCLPC